MKQYKTGSANIIMSDFPDLDVIRVDDAYYMVSTTMHFMPGCVILRSYNLIDWEFVSYVYDELDSTDGQTLKDNKGIYGRGMWAATIREHNGKFYVCFVANDTHKTYVYTASSITGPWEKSNISGFYHDMSLYFEEDGRVFVVCGNMNIQLIELESDLSGPKKGGVNKTIIQDNPEKSGLGYEGSHLYKINGKYYNFMIHMPKGKMRTEACYMADSIEGPWHGGDVLYSDIGGWNSGVAQGGIVQDKDGKWFGILFQDHGALGRIPVLVPVEFGKDGFPIFGIEGKGKTILEGSRIAPEKVTVLDNRPDYKYKKLWSNDFTNPCWQWNHIPNKQYCKLSQNNYEIQTEKLVENVTQATNTLTQRTFTEKCAGTVKIDASLINDGDFAGLCALEGEYGFIAVTKRDGKYYLVSAEHKIPYTPWTMGVHDDQKPEITFEQEIENPKIQLGLKFDLSKENQYVQPLVYNGKDFVPFGKVIKLRYTLDQFVGVRFALFCYSTKSFGAKVCFSDFEYKFW